MTRNDYLPSKCWFDNGKLMRGYFCYDENAESPRTWCNLGVIVNASSYNLCGDGDIEIERYSGEEWLINATGINEDWYYANKERYGGIDALVEKFEKEKCVAFEWLSVYDHSGVSVYCGKSSGWDYSNVGFIYVPKDNKEVKDYRKTHTLAETKEWARHILENEVHVLDQWANGNVYGCVTEEYDFETQSWDSWSGDSCWGYFLDDTTWESEKNDAINIIKEFAGSDTELYDEDVINKALDDNTLDVLLGQKVFEFMEIA